MRQSGGLSLAAGLDGGNTSIIIFFENDDANESVRGRGTAESLGGGQGPQLIRYEPRY